MFLKIKISIKQLWDSVEVDSDLLFLGRVLSRLYSRHFHHYAGSFGTARIVVFVGVVNDLFDSSLDYQLCTFVAWEKSCENAASVDLCWVFVQNRIHLCMTDEGVFCLQRIIILSSPRQSIVWTASRETIIANPNNPFVRVHDAGTDLSVRVFTSHRCLKRQRHKVVIPWKHTFSPLLFH